MVRALDVALGIPRSGGIESRALIIDGFEATGRFS